MTLPWTSHDSSNMQYFVYYSRCLLAYRGDVMDLENDRHG